MVSILQDTRNDISSSIVTRAHRVDTATVKMEHISFCESSACESLAHIDKHITLQIITFY